MGGFSAHTKQGDSRESGSAALCPQRQARAVEDGGQHVDVLGELGDHATPARRGHRRRGGLDDERDVVGLVEEAVLVVGGAASFWRCPLYFVWITTNEMYRVA